MKKRKIIYTGPFDPCLCDGVSASTFDLLGFLKEEGHEVSITSFMHNCEFSVESLQCFIKDNSIKDLSFENNKLHYTHSGIDVNIEYLSYDRQQVLQCHPEVLKRYLAEVNKNKESYFISADCDFSALMALTVSGNDFVHYVRSPIFVVNTYKNAPLLKNILKGKKVIVNSEFSRRKIEEELGVFSSFVLPPFISSRRFSFRQLGDVRHHNRNIGYYSAGKHKGDEIVGRLIERLPDCNFIIMGAGAYDMSLKKNNSCLVGKTVDLGKFYNEISVMLVPSTCPEGYSRVVLESAFNGIPVIASRMGGIPEAAGDSGILVDMNGTLEEIVERYVEKINGLFASPVQYESYRNKAWNRGICYQKDICRLTRDFADKFF